MACSSTGPVFNTPRTIPVDIAGTCHAGDPVSEGENALMDELGIDWVRNDFYWHEIESKKGKWCFEKYDRMVNDNRNSGRKILATLGFDVGWIHKNGKRKDVIHKDHLPDFLEYVEQVVTRYKGQVDAWEIWNEPNVPIRFWNGTPKEFYALVKATAEKIRACDPDAVIVGGVFFLVPDNFIRNMWKSGAMDNLDALSMHPYGVNPRATLRIYEKFETLVRKLGFTGEIWITEIGYPLAGFYPSRVSAEKFPDYIIQTITGLAAKGARTIFWYQLTESYTKDETPKTLNSEKFFGLAYRDFEKREGVDSFADIINIIRGSVFLEYQKNGNEELFRFRRPDRSIAVISWSRKNPPSITLEQVYYNIEEDDI